MHLQQVSKKKKEKRQSSVKRSAEQRALPQDAGPEMRLDNKTELVLHPRKHKKLRNKALVPCNRMQDIIEL